LALGVQELEQTWHESVVLHWVQWDTGHVIHEPLLLTCPTGHTHVLFYHKYPGGQSQAVPLLTGTNGFVQE